MKILFNERFFLCPVPSFNLRFTPDRVGQKRNRFIIRKYNRSPGERVAIFVKSFFVFTNTSYEIVCETCIICSVAATYQVYIIAFLVNIIDHAAKLVEMLFFVTGLNPFQGEKNPRL